MIIEEFAAYEATQLLIHVQALLDLVSSDLQRKVFEDSKTSIGVVLTGHYFD